MKPAIIRAVPAFEHKQAPSATRQDRRLCPRQRTIYRVACVRTATDRGMARVHNLSDEGMMIGLSLPVQLGDAIDIQLSDAVRVLSLIHI